MAVEDHNVRVHSVAVLCLINRRKSFDRWPKNRLCLAVFTTVAVSAWMALCEFSLDNLSDHLEETSKHLLDEFQSEEMALAL